MTAWQKTGVIRPNGFFNDRRPIDVIVTEGTRVVRQYLVRIPVKTATKRNPDVKRPGRGEPGGTGIGALPVRRAATSSQSKIPLTAGVRLAILWI